METYSLTDSNNIPLDFKLLPYILKIKSKGGFYVEAGANDGVSQSNTFLLEKYFD